MPSRPAERLSEPALNATIHPDARLALLRNWLASLPASLTLATDSLRPASSDASFRRYFRLDSGVHGTLIVMDAPPPQEDCRPFIDICKRLQSSGVHVPALLAENPEQGLLLLSDLGAQTYFERLQQQPAEAEIETLYQGAIESLIRVQQAPAAGLPLFDQATLLAELSVFEEWYLNRHHGVTLSDTERNCLSQIFETLTAHNADQTQVLVHRDYHSPNLMVPTGNSNQPGVIDFQDARLGPISYDLASLLLDARTTWEEARQLDWAIRYWEQARRAGLPVPDDFAVLHQDYEWMGLQRNLRILGVFARLNHRDGKAWYLAHLPRLNGYVRQVCGRYRQFTPLLRILDRVDQITPAAGYTF
ncbi:aminoglycoside phosphotransferase family protein [Kerstersia gyiorum]|uniref:aminoglycoside phosphotransferase family protein n=1 Tax=Kerstersia gyiorum TaxID=206506 RepID=UPI003B42A8AD